MSHQYEKDISGLLKVALNSYLFVDEILADARMKSAMQMKSIAWMKSNPSFSPAVRRISSRSDFIHLKMDLSRSIGRI